ncbi:MAG: YceI family protein [Streptosporangiaceae bacterium]
MPERTGLRPSRHTPGRAPCQRHWLLWTVIAVAAIVVLAVLGGWAFIRFQPTLPPLALPTGVATAPAGSLDGTWEAAAGSVAGFRVQETALGLSNDAVGRTGAVAGMVSISGGQVTSAAFRVDLTAITVNGKTQPQVGRSLDTGRYPDAAFTLTSPVALPPAFTSGATISLMAAGQLIMNGTAHPVKIAASARRDGTAIQAAGSIPVAFATWGIKGPGSFGFLGSLADYGTAEFLLTLRKP